CSKLDFQSADAADAAYSGVDENQTQDLIYDLSKSEVINDSADESDAASTSAAPVHRAAAAALLALVLALVAVLL
ncbi:hypothetical protein GGH99_007968, partial [Coemansia sp. RSA 1285]